MSAVFAHVDEVAEAEGIAELRLAAYGVTPYLIQPHVRLGFLIETSRELGLKKPMYVPYHKAESVAAHINIFEAFRRGEVYQPPKWTWLDHSTAAVGARRQARQQSIREQLKILKHLPGDKLIGTAEASAMIGMSATAIGRSAQRGRLKATCVVASDERRAKGGGARWCWRFSINDLRDLLKRGLKSRKPKRRRKGWEPPQQTALDGHTAA